MRTSMTLLLIVIIFQVSSSTVTDIKAEFRKGKTYLTWQEESDKSKSYRVYVSVSPINTIRGLKSIATVRCSSAYDGRYNHYHVIKDFGSPLTIGTGLFVNTPKSKGDRYYAVTTVSSGVEDSAVIQGSNATLSPVTEEYWQWPGAVIVSADSGYSYGFIMYYWMDYADWMHGRDYYGDFFRLCKHSSVKTSTKPIPLSVGLHGSSSNSGWQLPSASCQTGFYKIVLRDHGIPDQTYWYGLSNHYGEHALQAGDTIVNYTEMRILNYIMAIAKEPSWNVDTNRIYIGGSSMGGGGTFMTSFHNPGVFAAISPSLALVEYGYWGETQFVGKFGTRSLGLTSRNGENIWDHTSIPFLLKKYPLSDYPPVVSGIGSKDPKMSMRLYRWLYKVFAETKYGIWGAWGNFGHSTGSYDNINYERFKRNELYPAFANASNDDNYGQYDADTLHTATENDSLYLRCDSAGNMNAQIDWVSSLHAINTLSGNNTLIDNVDTIGISFTTSKVKTSVDITPRRIQNFIVDTRHKYNWINKDLATGQIVASGTITPDVNGLLTVRQFEINGTGNRLIITRGNEVSGETKWSEEKGRELTVSPNPFNPATTIKLPAMGRSAKGYATVTIISPDGRIIFTKSYQKTTLQHGISWDGSKHSSGVYIISMKVDGVSYKRAISLIK
ncbi:MAG: T9SS type A sorting domain-containing protein [Fibrobacteres bacterium]|nr:T9SS type A sorting domain-containing protein [Fibrobacterota bacterium]